LKLRLEFLDLFFRRGLLFHFIGVIIVLWNR